LLEGSGEVNGIELSAGGVMHIYDDGDIHDQVFEILEQGIVIGEDMSLFTLLAVYEFQELLIEQGIISENDIEQLLEFIEQKIIDEEEARRNREDNDPIGEIEPFRSPAPTPESAAGTPVPTSAPEAATPAPSPTPEPITGTPSPTPGTVTPAPSPEPTPVADYGGDTPGTETDPEPPVPTHTPVTTPVPPVITPEPPVTGPVFTVTYNGGDWAMWGIDSSPVVVSLPAGATSFTVLDPYGPANFPGWDLYLFGDPQYIYWAWSTNYEDNISSFIRGESLMSINADITLHLREVYIVTVNANGGTYDGASTFHFSPYRAKDRPVLINELNLGTATRAGYTFEFWCNCISPASCAGNNIADHVNHPGDVTHIFDHAGTSIHAVWTVIPPDPTFVIQVSVEWLQPNPAVTVPPNPPIQHQTPNAPRLEWIVSLNGTPLANTNLGNGSQTINLGADSYDVGISIPAIMPVNYDILSYILNDTGGEVSYTGPVPITVNTAMPSQSILIKVLDRTAP
jgi:hypothetical protein